MPAVGFVLHQWGNQCGMPTSIRAPVKKMEKMEREREREREREGEKERVRERESEREIECKP